MKITIIILAGLLLAGCCPRVLESSQRSDSVRHEARVEYRDRFVRDTTYLRDSVIVRERGDTVTVYRDRYHYRDRLVRDTVLVADTLYVDVLREREVVRQVKHVPSFFWWVLVVAVVAVGAWGVMIVGKVRRL